MIEKLRQKILDFINSDKDTPILAGFSVGLYLLLFYYSKNFALANSLVQLSLFAAFYIIIPVTVLFFGYKVLPLVKLGEYRRNYLFVGMLGILFYFIFDLIVLQFTEKGTLLLIIIAAWFISKKYKKYYKLFIILFIFLSFFNLVPILGIVFSKADKQWQKQPDNIEMAVFKKRPNIYYIQPDGYTNPVNFRDSIYNFDNTAFWNYLDKEGFKVYDNQRSNYYSTLLSNSSMFSMKHHYSAADVEKYRAREIIVGDNAVLRTLKNNNYKTHLISEKPYLIMNRPDLGYDYCNISYSEIPVIKDGWAVNYDVFESLKNNTQNISDGGNFFFIEKFTPGHIGVYERSIAEEQAIQEEKDKYLSGVNEANIWLEKVITYLEEKDPGAIIIIGADHGGFAGFAYSLQSNYKTTNKYKVNSMFGALLAIKWNDAEADAYDKELKTNVNIFRVLFSYLSQDKSYLENLQEDKSYVRLKEPQGLYLYINDKGEQVFEKIEK
ncbi:hypothetical protein FUA48_17515 [Flavobacterium alkalisoli]|uniref:Sulfatase N-terminal domain-containing protein n=1 Tax=Flavobacterium alkalisoli TaxID=2602769 RepID=A0A5B9FZM9_9FLAO|nr:hypothetical protein [Flavobacterium alkalisoli]QEE51298.1 hypothetical protein FUA48_17515 [Flavobacterium alkalisoli]